MRERFSRSRAGRVFAAVMTLSAFATPANAAMSDVLDTQGGSVRLVAAAPEADGTIPAVLDIALKPGWKTYWRDPGASGIPPSVSTDPAGGVALTDIAFPVPERFDDGTVRYIGYDRPVALPLLLQRQSGDASMLRVSVFLGICKDICIPVQGDLSLALDRSAADHPLDRARIEAAQRALPEAPSPAFRVDDSRIDAKGARIDLSLTLPMSEARPDLFVSGPAGFVFGQPEIVSNTAGKLAGTIEIRHRPKDAVLRGQDVRLVVRAGNRSMETPLAFD